MATPQDEVKPFYETPRVMVPGHVWVGAKEATVAIGAAVMRDHAGGPAPHTWWVSSQSWQALGVRAVICPAHNISLCYDEKLPVLRLPFTDTDTVAPEMFDLAVAFHRAHGERTFAHCNGGRNRSVTFAIALAHACHGMSLEAAAEHMNRPTDEMWASLKRWSL